MPVQPTSNNLNKIVSDILTLAQKRFKGQTLCVWYAKLGTSSWRAIIFNNKNKVVVLRGALKSSPASALVSMRDHLTSTLRKIS